MREVGWGPQHIIVRDDVTGQLLGCCPVYLKSHSYGEYVFDNAWANYFSMLGKRYYPKLQCCVPFTPVTGPRLLVRPGPYRLAVTKAIAESMIAVAGVSHGVLCHPQGQLAVQLCNVTTHYEVIYLLK